MAGERTKRMIGSWLAQTPIDQFRRMAEQGDHLVSLMKPYELLVKTTKWAMGGIDISADALLDWMLENYPEHGVVAFQHRDWFYQNADELRNYINNL